MTKTTSSMTDRHAYESAHAQPRPTAADLLAAYEADIAAINATHSSVSGNDPATRSARSEKDTIMADQPDRSIFDARVTAIRVASPTLSLTEAQLLARKHAGEEGFYAPGVGDGIETSQPVNVPEEFQVKNPLMGERDITEEEQALILANDQKRRDGIKADRVRLPFVESFDRDAALSGADNVYSVEERLQKAYDAATDEARKAELKLAIDNPPTATVSSTGNARKDVDNAFAELIGGKQAE